MCRRSITEDVTEWDRYILHLFLVLFCADDAFLTCQDHKRLQEAWDVLVWLFERMGLLTNMDKTQAIIYIPGKIRMRLSLCSYAR